jgi:hypothetical protein
MLDCCGASHEAFEKKSLRLIVCVKDTPGGHPNFSDRSFEIREVWDSQ